MIRLDCHPRSRRTLSDGRLASPRGLPDRVRQLRLEGSCDAWASLVPAFGIRHSAFRSGRGTRRGRRGQVAVEWLMVAGILTAVAIILTGMFQPVLVSVVRMIARSIRTVGL